MTFWVEAKDGNQTGYDLARRHYTARKRKPRVRQFVGPGEKLVLLGFCCNAVFAWQKQRDRMDGQEGVNCTIFRNESPHLSSEMILEAMDWAWLRWPGARLFTMINAKKIRSSNPGYCFKKAGWKKCGESKGGLIILECWPKTVDAAEAEG